MQHVHAVPVPPSERAPAPIPAGLEELILRCLAKDPAARPASALELGRALEELGELGGWRPADAQLWWQQRAPELVASARAGRVRSATPGPRTVAVDLGRRGSS